jgi:Uma2 family endonuclease
MAENTVQFRWIVTIEGGLEACFVHDPNVFVAGDLLWYPVEGDNTICIAPDAMVVFGRPKGDRGSYQQWLEDNLAPQVVFEIRSPTNRFGEMLNKFQFYDRYGVEEYYLYDPEQGDLEGWLRSGQVLREIPSMGGWLSPRLKVRFELVNGDLQLYGPDGRRFATYTELVEQREKEQREKEQAQQRADQAQQRAERLAAQLRALGFEPEP